MSISKHSLRAAGLLAGLTDQGNLIADLGSGKAPYAESIKGRLIRMDIDLRGEQDVVASLEALPYGDALFDGAICFQVLYYAPNPEEWVAELYRVLKPGGWVAWSVSKTGSVKAEEGYSPQTMAAWPGGEWDRAFTRAGFKLITPVKARLVWNKLGVYHFGLCRKPPLMK